MGVCPIAITDIARIRCIPSRQWGQTHGVTRPTRYVGRNPYKCNKPDSATSGTEVTTA